MIWRRLAGVSSSTSSVPRSRSPLIPSAPMIRPMKMPKEIALISVRNTISLGGIRFSSLFVASRNVMRPSRRL